MQNANLPPGALAGRLRADSVEAYAALHDGLWEVDVVQLVTGRVDAGAAFAATPGAVIYREHWDQPVHACGALRGDNIAIGFPAPRERTYRIAGKAAEGDSLHRLVQSSELEIVTGARYRNLVLIVDRPRLERALDACAPDVVAGVLRSPGCKLLRVGAQARLDLEAQLTDLAQAMLDGSLPPAWTAARWESEVLDALVGALTCMSEVAASPIEGRRQLVRDAIAWASEGDFDVSMDALCATTGRTRRALELSFKQVVGLSPARYFRQARLEGAFRDLARARPEQTTVTRVAMRWGFSELGRFAGTYRAWFGELPSETLARAPLHAPGLPGLSRQPANATW